MKILRLVGLMAKSSLLDQFHIGAGMCDVTHWSYLFVFLLLESHCGLICSTFAGRVKLIKAGENMSNISIDELRKSVPTSHCWSNFYQVL